jgi:multimeric flavodoxin WrbA
MMRMKVLAFNSSPLMEKGNTALILTPFLEGLSEEGAEVELFYICRLKINPCLGDRNCWKRTPGRCVQNDDMKTILPKVQHADIIVFATPVYVDGMTGTMKNLIDRLIPIIEPYFEMRKGHCRHPPRETKTQTKVVLVSNCGFWEMDNFDSLLMHMQAICKNTSWEFAGALLRPHGEALGYMIRKGYPVQDVLEAAKRAGKELAKTGKISEENLRIVGRELVSLEDYVKMTNEGFRRALDKLKQTNGK